MSKTLPKSTALEDAPFLRACRRQTVPHTPIWLLRQAGRYQAFYRAIRERVSLLELCKTPDLVAEVTVTAAARLDVDAAILFSDLLLPAEAFGLRLEFVRGEGPLLTPPIRDAARVDSLPEADPAALDYVYEGVRRTRQALPPSLPLIGFAGAPFTLASYLIEGSSSRHFEQTKGFLYRDEGAWNALLEKLVRFTGAYLTRQAEAGAQVLQIFDSWVGCLSPEDYRRYVQPHSLALLAALPPDVPTIHFGTGTASLLADLRDAGGTVIGLDWRVELDRAWEEIGFDRAVMGNLDPLLLRAPWERLAAGADEVLRRAGRRTGHVFNLGHGIQPSTDEDQVRRLVDYVKERSQR